MCEAVEGQGDGLALGGGELLGLVFRGGIAMSVHPGLIYWLVSGRCFFVGVGLLLVAFVLPSGHKARRCRQVSCTLIGVGFVLITCSATPFPMWIYLIWAALTVAWLTMRGQESSGRWHSKAEAALRVGVGLVTIAAFGLELPWHLSPTLVVEKSQPVYVIGDSLSAGLSEAQKQTWPQILAEENDIRVVNLSRAGATVKSAVSMTDKVRDENALVILEIGGNDLFGSKTVAEFGSELEELIQQIRSPGRTVVMFELPLFPLWSNYGRVQRRLSHQFGIKLIPKAVLAGVFTGPGDTIDSLHLTQQGHRRMAKEVGRMLRWDGTARDEQAD